MVNGVGLMTRRHVQVGRHDLMTAGERSTLAGQPELFVYRKLRFS
jgi:hypothetical protein